MSDPKSVKRLPVGAMRLAGTGVELAAAVAGGCLLGYWIDRHFKTSPWGLIICALLGIVGGLYNMIRQAMQEAPGSDGCKKERPGVRPGGRADR